MPPLPPDTQTHPETAALVASVAGVAVSDICRCHLPTRIPFEGAWWRPDLDDEPEPDVQAVVRYGQDPTLWRAVRTGRGWVPTGILVGCYVDITPPLAWERLGRCWAGTPHAVIACEP